MWNKLAGLRKDDCGRTKQRLSAYLDRRLSPEDQRRVEQHLADCRGCQEELHSLEATVALLHRLPQVSPSRSFRIARTEPSRRWTPVPALRLATVGAAMLLIMAFTADLTNLFNVSPSPMDDKAGITFNADNRSTAMEGDSTVPFGYPAPSNGEETDRPSDDVLGNREEADWVRPLEYGLAGVVIVLGSITTWLWLRPKRRPGHRPT
jgi:hypothetical protein